MRFNPNLKQDLDKYTEYIFIVEGKKDVSALNSLGFMRVYDVHKIGMALKERIEEIVSFLTKRDRVCILTDFDKKGKQLYLKIKAILSVAKGVKLDSSLRGILLKTGISHIEGLGKFMQNAGLVN